LAEARHCLDRLNAGAPEPRPADTASELRNVALRTAELSGAFRVPDCAAVATALAQAFEPVASGAAPPEILLALAAEALNYWLTRIARMSTTGRLGAPTDAECVALNRVVALLGTAGAPTRGRLAPRSTSEPATGHLPPRPDGTMAEHAGASDEFPDDPNTAALSAEDLAIIAAFQASPLRRAGQPLPASALALAPPDDRRRYTAPLDPAVGAMGEDLESLPARLHQVFLSDLAHNLQEMRQALAAFEHAPADRSQLASMGLIAHRMKGDAGTFEFPVLAELAHAFEEQLRALQSRPVAADATRIAILMRGLEELDRAYATVVAGQRPGLEALDRMRELTASLAPDPRAAAFPAGDAAQHPGAATAHTMPALPDLVLAEPAGMLESELSGSSPRGSRAETLVRIDVRRLDELVHRASALAINRAELEQVRATAATTQGDLDRAVTRLGELSARLREYPATGVATNYPGALTAPLPPPTSDATRSPGASTAGAEGAASFARPAAPEVERYSEYDQLTLALAEAVADVATCSNTVRAILLRLQRLTQAQEELAQDIQQAVMRVRLVPLHDQVMLLQRAIHVLAVQQGKAVTLVAQGELAEIDRDVSDALAEVLPHLVRNAVAHGIELPDERFAAGKPPEGQIWLSTTYSGNEVTIEVRDDGRGINPERVRASALAARVIDAATARALSPAEALNLIFQHGVSTVDRATPAAGHGIGMADVAATLSQLHGTIQVHSVLGEGTTFALRVPISLSHVRALRIQVAGQGYVVPHALVRQTLPLPARSEPPSPSDGVAWRLALVVDGRPEEVPLYSLARLLGQPYIAVPREGALVVEVASKRVALVVDRIIGATDVVVRSLPPHLHRHTVRGTTITPGGEVLLLLDLPALVALAEQHAGASRRAPTAQDRPVPPQPRPVLTAAMPARPRVLIADDSLSMRQVVEAMLTRAGYAVQSARDGMEALELVLADPPQVLILDIEMPRLDGFELLKVLRAQPQLAGIPVAMLTSRGAQRHQQHAEALGANAYLVKPVTEDDLLATVARLLRSHAAP
ncbi:MAG TPA: response regulator, partial [Ktedonobacterales bacterium]